MPVMDTWLNWARSIPNGPLIVLGLPAGPQAAGKPHYYFHPDKLATVYKVTNFVATCPLIFCRKLIEAFSICVFTFSGLTSNFD